MTRQVHFSIDDETEAALQRQMQRYKIGAAADVFRFALTVLDASPIVQFQPPEPRLEGRPAHRPVKHQTSSSHKEHKL